LAIGYAVWTGIGLLGAALLGMIFFDEPANTLRLVFLLTLTLTLALVGLRYVAPPE
jgi:multidrug transporter EmrE-like cation transporter|tara:strand:- start:710 stop:877 length:168 start_codon:yes stop_codon:yes gene_type:complete